ncbi:MAG: hypothetical protein COA50_02515 [Flavobacteriaceae bacterium]|nr:MAG: hypothetical protein COA50_02515 [Flavobacteriaceae bacterium]
MKLKLAVAFGILFLLTVSCDTQKTRSMNIYWIDVEGGTATLIVTPSGQSVLMDAGWPTEEERDAKRIVAAMENAGITEIDYFLVSHFHDDHIGGLPALAKRVPIGQFYDYGNGIEQNNESIQKGLDDYIATAKENRHITVAGDKLPLTGIDFTFVASHGGVLNQGLANPESNTRCDNATFPSEFNLENSQSLGYILSLGEFQFLNLGDLTENIQHKLACPTNLLGIVDLYQVPHHGDDLAPQLNIAIAPTVAVINNGAHKGGGPEGFEVISAIPSIKEIWQLHRGLTTDDAHSASAQKTANLTEENDAGHWIKATVSADGSSYTIENGRNGHSEQYLTK